LSNFPSDYIPPFLSTNDLRRIDPHSVARLFNEVRYLLRNTLIPSTVADEDALHQNGFLSSEREQFAPMSGKTPEYSYV